MTGRAIVLTLAFATAATLLFSPRFTREMRDFEVYWTAAARARAGEPLYRPSDLHYQFKYLPAFAVLAAPVSLLPLADAKRLWFGLSVVLLVTLIGLSLRVPSRLHAPRSLLALAAVVSMGKFYGHELVLGQVNLLFAAVVVASLLALGRGREPAAGVGLALAILVKPYAAVFLPWLVAIRRTRAAATAGVLTLAALALPTVSYGVPATIALHRDWWTTVASSTAPNLLNQDNVSVAAMWARWAGPGPAADGLALASGAVLLLVAGVAIARRGGVTFPEGLEGALLLVLIPLLSPQGWDYVFLVATPAVILIVNERGALPAALRALTLGALAVVGLSLFDLMGRAAYARFMSWSVITLCFLVVVVALGELRRRRAA